MPASVSTFKVTKLRLGQQTMTLAWVIFMAVVFRAPLDARHVVMAQAHKVVKRSAGELAAVREGSAREGLKVEQAGVSPPSRLFFLHPKQRSDVRVAARIDQSLQRFPCSLHRPHRLHARGIPVTQFIPQSSPRAHDVVPGDVMKPQQELFGTRLDLLQALAHGGWYCPTALLPLAVRSKPRPSASAR